MHPPVLPGPAWSWSPYPSPGVPSPAAPRRAPSLLHPSCVPGTGPAPRAEPGSGMRPHPPHPPWGWSRISLKASPPSLRPWPPAPVALARPQMGPLRPGTCGARGTHRGVTPRPWVVPLTPAHPPAGVGDAARSRVPLSCLPELLARWWHGDRGQCAAPGACWAPASVRGASGSSHHH